MSEFALGNLPDITLTGPQRNIVEADLGVVGTWWRVMSAPRSFFIRAGVHAGNYGDDLLVASGDAPNAFIFFFVIQIVSLLVTVALSGSLLSSVAMILQQVFGVMGLVLAFYLMSGVVHLLAKLLRCPGDFMAAQSIVAFTAAPWVLLSLGTLLFGLPALLGVLYSVVLLYFALRHVYRSSIAKAVVMWVVVCAIGVVGALAQRVLMGQ